MPRKSQKADRKKERLPLDLIRTAEISSVRLESLSAHCQVASAQELPNRSLRVQFKTDATDLEGLSFRVRAQIDALAGGESEREDAPVRVRAVYILCYTIPKGAKPSKRDLGLFAETNALLNIWPYWRQLVQDMSLRMELPPIVLPLFRLGQRTSDNTDVDPSTAGEPAES